MDTVNENIYNIIKNNVNEIKFLNFEINEMKKKQDLIYFLISLFIMILIILYVVYPLMKKF